MKAKVFCWHHPPDDEFAGMSFTRFEKTLDEFLSGVDAKFVTQSSTMSHTTRVIVWYEPKPKPATSRRKK